MRLHPVKTRALPTMYHGGTRENFDMTTALIIVTTTMKIIRGSSRTPASSGPSPYILLAVKKHIGDVQSLLGQIERRSVCNKSSPTV